MEIVCRVSGECLVGVWRGLKGVWKLPGGCLEGIYGMSELYVMCLDSRCQD